LQVNIVTTSKTCATRLALTNRDLVKFRAQAYFGPKAFFDQIPVCKG
jgi:hypothetical protein